MPKAKKINPQPIIDNISKHITLDEEERAFFVSLLTHKKVKLRQRLLNEGDICRHSTFVINGCLRGYTIDQNGFEHILSFAPSDWWIADMYSLLSQKPGLLTIEALSDTEVFLLAKTDQERLYEAIPKFERFFRLITEKSLVANQQRLIDNLSLSAEERYNKFCTVYPDLIFTIPQKQVASYIGVTPEFLSKMKARINSKRKEL